MKSARLLVIIMLAGVCAFSWINFASGLGAEDAQQQELLAQAEELRQKGLYEGAIEKTYEAAAVRGDEQCYDFLLKTVEEYYAEDPSGADRKREDAYLAACQACPGRVDYWEGCAQLYLDGGDMADAASVLRRARARRAESQKLTRQWRQAYYAYEALYQDYLYLSPAAVSGLYTFQTEDGWGVTAAGGSEVIRGACSYVGPVSEEGDGCALAVLADGEVRVLNGDGVSLARFSGPVVRARGFGEGLVAVQAQDGGSWSFLDNGGQERLGGYLQAGMFQNGAAAVQLSDGQWLLIDAQGQPLSEERWDEILLADNGAYLHGERMIVRRGQNWLLCDGDGAPLGDTACQQMDLYFDGPVAFCQNGKWGFMNEDGEVVIEPAYDGAHSFSGGVAAVCRDGLWGFIDEDGELVVDYTFADAGYFDAGTGCCRVLPEDSTEYCFIRWQVSR